MNITNEQRAMKAAMDLKLRSTSICFFHHPGLPCANDPSKVDVVLAERIDFPGHSFWTFDLKPFLSRGSWSGSSVMAPDENGLAGP